MTLQCIFCGGMAAVVASSRSACSTSMLVIFIASSTVFPMIISHIMSLEAMAVPQPNVLNFASRILLLLGSTAQKARIASPQTSAPQSATTSRAPIASACSWVISPRCRGLSMWSFTLWE